MTRPQLITISLYCFIAAAALALANGLITVLHTPTIAATRRSLIASGAKGPFPDSAMQATINTLLVIAIAGSILLALAYVGLGLWMWQAKSWARILLTIVAVFSLLITAGSGGIGIVQGIFVMLGTILMFLPKSNLYFRAGRMARLQQPS